MTRVMVIGNAGGGKSTMCGKLSSVHALPYFAIDKIQWKPGWTQTLSEEYEKAHESLIAGERWLVDGYGSWESVLKRMDAADTIIVIDHPIWVHYWWATKRQLRSLFHGRPDGPTGCPMWPVTLRLYKMMWRLHRVQRSMLLTEAESRSTDKRFIHIQSPSALKKFVDNPV